MKCQGQILKTTMLATIGALLFSEKVFAGGPPVPSELSNSLAIVLVSVAVVLLLAIGMLSYVLIGAAELYVERLKEKNKSQSDAGKIILLFAVMLMGTGVFAADPSQAAGMAGLSSTSFNMLVSIIALELIIILAMLYYLKMLVTKEKDTVMQTTSSELVHAEPAWKVWWDKLNSFRPVSEEKDMLLDHDYDGIRELDNRLPPWWLYGFYLTIFFGCIYLYRYHVAGSAPLPGEELQIAMQKAEMEKEEYLKHAANKVDENTVTLIADAGKLADGKKLFIGSCAACHGVDGGGSVGPNLTDDYWLHKGGIKDIFKTIKYGVPEKGMKSWKDDFSPGQIAELASFVKSLHGTKPATPKDPQGDIYKEENVAAQPLAPENKIANNP